MTRRCQWCRAPFVAKRSHARFCGNPCVQSNYRYHHRLGTATRPPETKRAKRCAECATAIGHLDIRAIYCGQVCKQRAWRSRVAA